MVTEYYDPIYGLLELTPLESDLLSLPDVQRLRWIKHLTFCYITFPSAKYTRYEHVLGLLGAIKQSLGYFDLTPEQALTLRITATVHDLGQGPFGQAYNDLVRRNGIGKKTQHRSAVLMRENVDTYMEILERHKPEINRTALTPKKLFEDVTSLLEGSPKNLSKLLYGGLGLDRIEYYTRDAHYSGVSPGRIHPEYLYKGIDFNNASFDLVFGEDALPSIEAALMRRGFLYFLVYSDPASRRAQAAMTRAMELAANGDVERVKRWSRLTDCEMWNELKDSTAAAALYEGQIPKSIVFIRRSDEQFAHVFRMLDNLLKKDPNLQDFEKRLTQAAGSPPGTVIVEHDQPLVQNDIEGIAVYIGGRLLPLENSKVAQAAKTLEDRLEIFGVYSFPGVDEQKLGAMLKEVLSL